MRKRTKKRMYAVCCEGVGIISGTLAYSRKDAIRHFQHGAFDPPRWEQSKRAGYRTVQAAIKIIAKAAESALGECVSNSGGDNV